jgi:hypothetical protein
MSERRKFERRKSAMGKIWEHQSRALAQVATRQGVSREDVESAAKAAYKGAATRAGVFRVIAATLRGMV